MVKGYVLDEKLTDLIQGKRVVIVGPSGHLMNKGLGETINGYDTVCRSNYFAAKNFEADYGDRTDIMFYNCCTISLPRMKNHIECSPEVAKNIKLVVCPVVKAAGKDKWKEWDLDFLAPVTKNFATIDPFGLDFCWIGIRNYVTLINHIDCVEPNSGVMAIAMILEHKPKELFVTGLSFYSDPNIAYFKDYPMQPANQAGLGHNQKKQREYFKRALESGPIVIDSYLQKVLDVNHKNVVHI